jgi:hypothetical protein
VSLDQLHNEWLSLIEISGPFLAVPVLKEVFPQGLEELDSLKSKRLRQAYEEWREALETNDPEFSQLHTAWLEEVLNRVLDFDADGAGNLLKRGNEVPESLHVVLPEHDTSLAPDFALIDELQGNKPLLLVKTYPAETYLEAMQQQDGWVSTPADRMVQLCRMVGCRLGLITNGEHWMLVDGPVGAVATFASWYARIWGQEPITLQAFVNLLGIRRFFVDTSEQLPALLDRSLSYQDEVTAALGEQVCRAVEVLIQALDRADVDRNRELLRDVDPTELYEAALTVMMRLVFLLSAEERGLLLLGDERYEAYYAISTLRMQLRTESEEILERRWDAWSRLLAIFRAVFGGIEHENLPMPALGGSLFDPDRFPFLEGRAKGSNWRIDAARPLPIDNRTVLLLLNAIQQFHGRTLSYRALDVEQIGYVYEGLLERTVKRVNEVTMELDATKNAKHPLVTLGAVESAALDGVDRLTAVLQEHTGSSASRIFNDLAKSIDDDLADRLLTACHGDVKLRDRIKHYAHLLRTDPWGYPLVYPTGTFIVTTGSDRRETGTHYTPKSLTETIVAETLTPIAYAGPSEGKAREEWVLKSPDALLDLKICDPAMGSGAFLVQVCRWMAERLVESWILAESNGYSVNVDGLVSITLGEHEPLPRDADDRMVIARRLIAERCLYGVDLNPLAVELAKLSIWLVTLARGRPFGFLDHNLRSGDSLLGVHRLDQLTDLNMTPDSTNAQMRVFGHNIEQAVQQAIALRSQLREIPIRDIRDVEVMAQLDSDARGSVEIAERIADVLVGEMLRIGGKVSSMEPAMASLAVQAEQAINGNKEMLQVVVDRAHAVLLIDHSDGRRRRPFHWPVEFPEVFSRDNPGFDAIVGNPPFLGNRLWKGSHGDSLQRQCQIVLNASPGKIDLCVVFHRRAMNLLRGLGSYGLLATSNIAEGSAISVGLGVLVQNGDIYFSRKSMPWPGNAAVDVAIVCIYKGDFQGPRYADGYSCHRIGSRLEPESGESWEPKELLDAPFAFEGVNNSKGLAFVINPQSPWYAKLAEEPDSLLRPYVTGDDLTSSALTNIMRWALDIADRSLEEIESRWPIAHRFLIEEVKPTRTPSALKSYKGLIDRWWQFWNHRAEPMRRLRRRKLFVAFSKVTKYPICMPAPTDWIYTNKVLLIEAERQDMHAICLSSLFRAWLQAFSGGKLEGRLVLSISESVAKYPLPLEEVSRTGVSAARRFNELAVEFSAANHCGLTEVMNSMHAPQNGDKEIQELRNLLVAIDREVISAYGWTDLDIEYDFRDFDEGSPNDRWRWRLDGKMIERIVERLTLLNKERYTNVLEQDRVKRSSAGNSRKGQSRSAAAKLDDLFTLDRSR